MANTRPAMTYQNSTTGMLRGNPVCFNVKSRHHLTLLFHKNTMLKKILIIFSTSYMNIYCCKPQRDSEVYDIICQLIQNLDFITERLCDDGHIMSKLGH